MLSWLCRLHAQLRARPSPSHHHTRGIPLPASLRRRGGRCRASLAVFRSHQSYHITPYLHDTMDMEALAQITATGLAGLFTGAAAYITMAQHPALLETRELAFQAPYFRRMYFYAARLQGPMAVGSGLSSLSVYFLQRSRNCGCPVNGMPRLWLASGGIMVAMVPYTVMRMLAVNARLMDTKQCRSKGSAWLQSMLRKWGRLHDVRTGASLIAFTGMLVALTCSNNNHQLQGDLAVHHRAVR